MRVTVPFPVVSRKIARVTGPVAGIYGASGCAFPGHARRRRFEHRTVLGVTRRLSCVTVPFAVVSRRIARVTGPVAGTGPWAVLFQGVPGAGVLNTGQF